MRPAGRTLIARGAVALAAALALWGAAASAAEFKSIGNDPAILYDAPTLRGTRLFVAPRGMPVEVIVTQGDWSRVRDATGDLAWVERKALSDKRTVVVNNNLGTAEIRAAPADTAPVVFRAQAGVVLDVTSAPTGGWVAVRHRDGESGFARGGDVWGD